MCNNVLYWGGTIHTRECNYFQLNMELEHTCSYMLNHAYRKGAIIRQEPVFGSKQITCIKSRTLRTHLTQTMNLVIGTLPLLQINTVCHLST